MKDRLTSAIKLLIGWPLSLTAIYFIGKLILGNTNALSAFTHIQPILLFLGMFSYCGYFLGRCIFWYQLLRLKHHEYSFGKTAFLWSYSELRRYIPGNFWSFISRVHFFETKIISKTAILRYQIIETAFLILSAFFVSIFSLHFLLYSMFPTTPSKLFFSLFILTIVLATVAIFLSKRTVPFFSRYFPLKELSFFNRLSLFFTMTLSWIFFGAGSYFTIAAVWPLSANHFVSLIGFFTLSFLIGYLSLITPMGLGVREAITAAGLIKYLKHVSDAASAALLSRIILIITELLVLGIFALIYKFEKQAKKIATCIVKHKHIIILWGAIICYCLYFTTASFFRYNNFYTGRFDLGNMDQTVWNTLHGRIFQLTDPDGTNITSRFATHADVLLILLAPFYVIWQDPRMLLLIQTIVIALGALFVYFLSKDILREKGISLIISICFLLNPSLQYSNLYDFHPVVLGTTFLLGAFYFLKKRQYWFFFLFAILAGITKEEVWAVIGIMGIYVAAFEKKWWGVLLFASGIGLTYYLIAILIPHFRGTEHFALSYYTDFGSTPLSITKTILLSPQKIIGILLQSNRLVYLFDIFLPLGFISLLNPFFLIFTLPDFAINLLSSNEQFFQIYYQYTATITPFLFISAIYGFRFLHRRFTKIPVHFFSWYILGATLVAVYFFGPLFGSRNPNIDMFTKPVANAIIINNFLDNIPLSFSVAASNNLGSHLSHRQKIFTIPIGIDKADVIAFLLNDAFAQPSLIAQKQMAEKLKRDKAYIEIFKLDDFIVFEKRNLYAKKEPNLTRVKLFPIAIPSLQHRDFVGGIIHEEKFLSQTRYATEFLVSYPSDGLNISAEVYIPKQQKPKNGFPVIILNRGYIAPQSYDITSSYNAISEQFAGNGFVVFKPEYRGSGTSDIDNSSSVILSYPIDTLNLLSSFITFPEIDTRNVFLWGHSVGGGTVLTTLEAHDQNKNLSIPLRAASVWTPVTNPFAMYTVLHQLFPTQEVPYADLVENIGTPQKNPLIWQSVSPIFYLDDIATPLSISHGAMDTILPYQSSVELYNDLRSLNKSAQLIIYQNDDHALTQDTTQAVSADSMFFKMHMLK
ncbi:MAG TPA: DUF2079 domain-containing protein [Patescibacteria group bacterium]|nr:DUF2079 domain-containing protein [Patescibacteria group bacterium]